MSDGVERAASYPRYRIWNIATRLRRAYKDGKLTEEQIARLEAIGFKREPRRIASLAETHPKLAKQWHPTKNGDLTPRNVTAGSTKKVWWRHWCEETGTWHEWEASIQPRAVRGVGCPYCSNIKVLVGFNDLATVRPDIANEWHPTKNGDLTPKDVGMNTHKRVWWKCPKGHEWLAEVKSRTRNNCPYCSNKKILPGFNDLATTHPELAAEWHPTRNDELTPRDVVVGSGKVVWWKCKKCGGEWKAAIRDRAKGKGCPYDSGRAAIAGRNDLATTHPELAKQWHPTKNGDLTPRDVKAGSGKKVWWRHWCEETGTWHEWEAVIGSRKAGCGCPICKRSLRLPLALRHRG